MINCADDDAGDRSETDDAENSAGANNDGDCDDVCDDDDDCHDDDDDDDDDGEVEVESEAETESMNAWMDGWMGWLMDEWWWMDESFVVLWYYEVRCDVVSIGGMVWFGLVLVWYDMIWSNNDMPIICVVWAVDQWRMVAHVSMMLMVLVTAITILLNDF